MKHDTYGEVINGADTYEDIALDLKEGKTVLIGWTDNHGTHFDILFSFCQKAYGNNIQGGIRPRTDLFVSIMRWGCFAFDVDHEDTAAGYYEEKLCTRGKFGADCAQAVADLINGVKKYL